MISVIIPVLNEELVIPGLLGMLDGLLGEKEVLFVDGGSTDATLSLLQGRKLLHSEKGRAKQLNMGSLHAKGETLFFLHADSILEKDALLRIEKSREEGALYGCLRIHFDKDSLLMKNNAFFSHLRAKVGRTPFGDQGIFIDRDLFYQMGSFPEMALMEDYAFTRRLKRRGVPLTLLDSTITTSARRYGKHPLKTMAKMFYLRHLFRRGVDPSILERHYRDRR